MGKTIVPQPAQLFGLNAQARYVSWKQGRDDDASRQADQFEASVRGSFTLDERKLKSLTKVLRATESDVLVERPEEFTRGFLKAQGVWELVEDRYNERVA